MMLKHLTTTQVSRSYLQNKDDMLKFINIIFSLIILISCSRDMGNYEYHDLYDPKISSLEDISALTFTHLSVKPSFADDFNPENYVFEWKAIDDSGTSEGIVIGTSPELDCDLTLTPGSYTLYFTVTERSTGIFWQQTANLTVNSSTSEGWMVLCSDGGRTRLDFVSAVTGETYKDVLSGSDMPQMNGPRKIQWLPDKTDASSPYYLLTDEGATRLGKDSFEWKPEYDFSYEAAINDRLIPHSIVSAGFGKVIVSQGNAHYCEIMGFDGLYGSAVNKGFKVSEYVGANVLATQIYAAVHLLYDIDGRKMKAYCPLLASNDLGGLDPVMDMEEFGQVADGMNPGAGVLGNAFEQWPEGYDCLYMENTRYDPGNEKMGMTYVVLTDGVRCHLYGVQLGDLLCYSDCTYVLGKGLYADLTSCKDILKTGNLFAFSSLKNYMYYATGDSVYRIDLSAEPYEEELQFTLSGEEITCMKFNLYHNTDNQQRTYDLVVGSRTGADGILRIYNGTASDGDFRSVAPETYRGFAEIADATYKERIY